MIKSNPNNNLVKSDDTIEDFKSKFSKIPKNMPAMQLPQLNSSNYVVAYLDVLGATKYMEDDGEQFLNNLNVIYDSALSDVMFTNVITKKNIDIKIFSDNILIVVETSQNDINRVEKIKRIAELAGNIYRNALDYGYLIRGGITEGKFYKNNTFVFGKALVEAVRLEEKIAIYPRIIVQDKLISSIPQYVILDNDGKYYLNSFIYRGLRKLNFKPIILNLLEEFGNKEDVKQKIMWLVSYFNHFYSSQAGNETERIQITMQEINERLQGTKNLSSGVVNE